MSDTHTFLPESSCPRCKYLMDATTPMDAIKSGPGAGDFTICLNCGTLLRFTDHLYLREMEPEELDELGASQRIMINKAQALIWSRGPLPKKMGGLNTR